MGYWILCGLFVVGVIVWFILSTRKKIKNQQEAIQKFHREVEEFESWRNGMGIQRYKTLGGYQVYDCRNVEGLIIDTVSRKLCKVLTCLSYDFSELTGVEISKQFARESNGVSNSARFGVSGGIRSARVSNSSTSRNTVRTSQDVSTYTVMIRTNLLSNSLITIPCGTGREVAEEIKATVKNIIAENKKTSKEA